jgi:pSer/pThr/pTyr-binding forkhead associated (FHA) protein
MTLLAPLAAEPGQAYGRMVSLPHRLHASTPAELKERLQAEREGSPFLVYRDDAGAQRIVSLDGAGRRLSVGRQSSSDIPLTWDTEVSRVHAAIECIGSEWTIVDDGSRNGTFVDGVRVRHRRRLKDGDTIRLGGSLLVYCAPRDRASEPTAASRGPEVYLSPAQRRVLVALCRPYAIDALAVPPSNRQLAGELCLGVNTVKAHLRALFDAFELHLAPQNQKRALLARAALASGAVSWDELAAHAGGGERAQV